MDLIGTHAQLRVNQQHLRQIATDVARLRGTTEHTRNGITIATLRRLSIAPLRRSLGIVMVRTGTWLSGPPTTMTTAPVVEQP